MFIDMSENQNQEESEETYGVVFYRYMPWDAFEKTLNSWSLKATIASQTNDFFEFLPAKIKESSANSYQREIARDNKALLCFSKKMSNCAMWGHYADQYRGVCMAFYFPNSDLLKEVIYKKDRVVLNNDENNITEEIMITKDESWKYEVEHRLIYDAEAADMVSNGMLFYSEPMNYFIGVILGPKCPYPVGYVKALIKLYQKNKNINSKPNMDSPIVVTKGYPHETEFSIESKFWNDKLNYDDLKGAGLLAKTLV